VSASTPECDTTERIDEIGMSLNECGGCACQACGGLSLDPDAETCTCNYPTADEPWGHACVIAPEGFCTDMSEVDGVVVDRDMSDGLIHVPAPPFHPPLARAPIIPYPPARHTCAAAHRPRADRCRCCLRNRTVCVCRPSWCQGAPRSPPSARPSQTPVCPPRAPPPTPARHAAQPRALSAWLARRRRAPRARPARLRRGHYFVTIPPPFSFIW
jgi:hypothetical protein